MAKYTIKDSTMTAVADKLREKVGTAKPITPEEMPEKVDEVFEAGEKSEWDRFWDAYQENGNKMHYYRAFANNHWNDVSYDPKYPIICNGGNAAQQVYYNAQTLTDTKVPIRLIGANATQMFTNCYELLTIREIEFTGEVTTANIFAGCASLRNVSIVGTLERDIDLHWSTKLTHDSLKGILNALSDRSADESGTTWTLTLGEENLAKLTEEEIGIAERKGWVLA